MQDRLNLSRNPKTNCTEKLWFLKTFCSNIFAKTRIRKTFNLISIRQSVICRDWLLFLWVRGPECLTAPRVRRASKGSKNFKPTRVLTNRWTQGKPALWTVMRIYAGAMSWRLISWICGRNCRPWIKMRFLRHFRSIKALLLCCWTWLKRGLAICRKKRLTASRQRSLSGVWTWGDLGLLEAWLNCATVRSRSRRKFN
jgi:hypothetical protein